MRSPIALGLTVALLLLSARDATAAFIVSVSSTSDVSNLSVGQVVTFDVAVSGLEAGESINFLGVTIDSSSASLGATTVTPGSIVPTPLGFTASPPGSIGFASAVYDDINFNPPPDSYPPISANGTFFSFRVTALAPGNGILSFSAFDSLGNVAGSSGGPLTFSISAAGAERPVPEPSMWVGFFLGTVVLIGRFRLG